MRFRIPISASLAAITVLGSITVTFAAPASPKHKETVVQTTIRPARDFRPAVPPIPNYKRQAMIHQAQGNFGRAIGEYRRAVALNPADAASHNNLALALKDLGLLNEAEAEERAAIKLKPKQANYHYNLALILQHKTKLGKAASELKRAAKLKDDSDIHYRLAQVYLETAKAEQAENQVRIALASRPHDPTYLRLLGDSLMLQNREQEALGAYSQASRLLKKTDPDLKNKIEYLTQRLTAGSGIGHRM